MSSFLLGVSENQLGTACKYPSIGEILPEDKLFEHQIMSSYPVFENLQLSL